MRKELTELIRSLARFELHWGVVLVVPTMALTTQLIMVPVVGPVAVLRVVFPVQYSLARIQLNLQPMVTALARTVGPARELATGRVVVVVERTHPLVVAGMELRHLMAAKAAMESSIR